jgi:hypothetical protein
MNITSAVSALLNQRAEPPATDNRNSVSTPFFGSKRFIVVAAVIGIAVFWPSATLELVSKIVELVVVYVAGESAVRLGGVLTNGWIKVTELKVATPCVPGNCPYVAAAKSSAKPAATETLP